MTPNWSTFLKSLNPTGKMWICPMWRMSNGSSFYMSIPSADEVFEDELSGNLEFPFRLAEIVEMEFQDRFAIGKQVLECDLDVVAKRAIDVGLLVERDEQRAVISSPVST
jgi:hypothetical protein